jgi:hypothetical protein
LGPLEGCDLSHPHAPVHKEVPARLAGLRSHDLEFARGHGWLDGEREKRGNELCQFLLVGKKQNSKDNGQITVEQAQEKQQKIGTFDSRETFALKTSRIHTICDDCVAECKKWWENERKEEKGGET